MCAYKVSYNNKQFSFKINYNCFMERDNLKIKYRNIKCKQNCIEIYNIVINMMFYEKKIKVLKIALP
jgi:hypothetical protein